MASWRKGGNHVSAPSSPCVRIYWVRLGPSFCSCAVEEFVVMGEFGSVFRLTRGDGAVSLLTQVASCVNDLPFMGEFGAKLG